MQDSYDHAECMRLIESTRQLAVKAGEKILEIYEKGFDVIRKSDHSPVTTADLASHEVIRDGLAKLTPRLPLISEEAEHLPFETRRKWSSYWLVDPLDGTREFIKRNDEFCINIALIHHHEPVLGIIYSPVLQLCYYACRGKGAYRQTATGIKASIQTRKTTAQCPTVVSSRSHADGAFRIFLDRIGTHEHARKGSALKSCMVAEGSADIYPRFGPTSEWDTAAAQCIVEEAGGRLTDMQMQVLRYNEKASLENPPFVVFGDREFDWSTYL
ncbi:MAG: 3'(2'),5'-bisphosphate nucleotidase CysQ [Pseudomonadota bacterium]